MPKLRTDEMMTQSAAALSRGSWFEAERLALKALHMAREADDFVGMARIVLPLQEARRQRLQEALDQPQPVRTWTEPITGETTVTPGCWLIEPPMVGADARQLRLIALQAEVPAAVICREPKTQLGLWPIVAIGGGSSLRTRIRPPRDEAKPDIAWFAGALEAIGDEASESIDPAMEITRRIDALLHRLDIVPEHEKLHQELADACRAAAKNFTAKTKAAAAK